MNKTKFSLTIVLLMAFVGSIFAQQPLQHEKRWYVAPDSTFYINWELPVYLRLATSPEASAPTHLLTSKTSPQYSNPMYLEKGYNTIRSPWRIDPKTRKLILPKTDVVFDIYADADAPVTRVYFKEAPRYFKGGKIYYGKGLLTSLKAKDALSGVEKTYISVNGENFKEFTKDIELDKEGEYSVKYYSADNVGNAEKVKENKIIVDVTAPTSKLSLKGDFKGNKISARTKIILTSTDDLSGVKATYYSIDGQKPRVYTGPISTAPLLDGEHSFIFYAIDNVKNNNAGDQNMDNPLEGALKKGLIVDRKAPITSIKINGDYYKGKYEYISERSKVELSATDKPSGVLEIKYGVDRTVKNTYSNTFSLPNKKGLHTVNYNATDELTNVARTKTQFYYMDNVAPTTGITYKYPKFFNRDTLFINNKTDIKLFAGDYESGVAKIEYSVDGGAYKTYDKEFNIANEGFHTIKFRSTDRVNNVEKEKTSSCLVDNNAPNIFVNFSIESIAEQTKDGKKYDTYPSYARLYVAATDRFSGTEKIYYTINGGTKRLYISAADIAQRKLLSKDGFYTVKISAVDKLGNTSDKEIKFFVRNK